MAEYGSMFLVSGLGVVLYLGAWNGPIPILEPIAYQSLTEPFHWGGFLANVAGVANFIVKSTLLVTVMMWVRWTLPRLRIDQVMKTCLKYCMPIVCFTFLGATIWTYFLPGGLFLRPDRPLGEFRDQSQRYLQPPLMPGEAARYADAAPLPAGPPVVWNASNASPIAAAADPEAPVVAKRLAAEGGSQ